MTRLAHHRHEGTVASWYWAVWVRALDRVIVLCPWAKHSTLIVPVTAKVCKWIPVNIMLRVTL